MNEQATIDLEPSAEWDRIFGVKTNSAPSKNNGRRRIWGVGKVHCEGGSDAFAIDYTAKQSAKKEPENDIGDDYTEDFLNERRINFRRLNANRLAGMDEEKINEETENYILRIRIDRAEHLRLRRLNQEATFLGPSDTPQALFQAVFKSLFLTCVYLLKGALILAALPIFVGLFFAVGPTIFFLFPIRLK